MMYSLPEDICAKSYGGFMLLISPSSGKWIVLDSQKQIEIFKAFLSGLDSGEVNERFRDSPDEVAKVISQIDGRNFVQENITEEDAFTLRLYITNSCNLRCTHCFMYASKALDDELDTEEICRLFENCRSCGCVKVILTGGEVLMRRDFPEILRCAASLGMYVQVLTNGTLWTEQKVHELSEYIDEVQISIDGYDEDSNAKIRGHNAFAPAVNALDMFLRETDIFTSAVITPSYDGLQLHRKEYTDFVKGLVKNYEGRNFLAVIQRELTDGRNLKADSSRNKLMTETVNAIYEEVYENSELTTFIMNHRGGRIFKNCGYGNLTVSSAGDVYFCGNVHAVRKYANIRTTAFAEIMSLRKNIRRFSGVDYVMPCRDCELKYICGGGCRVKNFPEIVRDETENFGAKLFTRRTECTEHDKEKLYRLMIESNSFLMR